MITTYRVLLGDEQHRQGVWRYSVDGTPIEGLSRQPLLDACRQIKSLYGATAAHAGLFHAGSDTPSLTCSVETGAKTTVSEGQRHGPVFTKFKAFAVARHGHAGKPAFAADRLSSGLLQVRTEVG
jgi:hypothetical protein